MGANLSQLPYNIGPEVVEYRRFYQNALWTLHEGTKKDGGDEVSIFSCNTKNVSADRVAAAENCLKNLRKYRHPHILKFIDGITSPETISIVTERVTSLAVEIGQRRLKNHNAISLGLSQLTIAISFLHHDVNVSHNNLCSSSVFVTPSGDWKLGGLELMYEFSGPAPRDTKRNVDLLDSVYQSMELSRGNWGGVIEKSVVWAVDSWSLGCLMYECFNGFLTNPRDLTNTGSIPKSLLPEYRACLSRHPRTRFDPKKLVDSKFLDNHLVKSMDFLDNIAVKNDDEKERFFKALSKRIDAFPEPCCKYRILPLLTQALEFGSGSNHTVLTSVLKIGKKLSTEEYNALVVPCVVRLFASPDRATRINLLKNASDFVPHLTQDLVNDKIFPNVISGFTDETPFLRELTARSVLHFVKKLSVKTINNTLLPTLVKLQTDNEPAIRTNTTIILSKIAAHISSDKRPKILLSGFSRAMKDNFVPARAAALQGLKTTLEYFEPDACAKQVLPMIAPHAVDPHKKVRVACLQCIATIAERLKTHSDKMDELPDPDQQDQASSTGGQAVSTIASYSGWAVNAVKSKVYGDNESRPTSSHSNRSSSSFGSPKSNTNTHGGADGGAGGGDGGRNDHARANRDQQKPSHSRSGSGSSSERITNKGKTFLEVKEDKSVDEWGDDEFFNDLSDEDAGAEPEPVSLSLSVKKTKSKQKPKPQSGTGKRPKQSQPKRISRTSAPSINTSPAKPTGGMAIPVQADLDDLFNDVLGNFDDPTKSSNGTAARKATKRVLSSTAVSRSSSGKKEKMSSQSHTDLDLEDLLGSSESASSPKAQSLNKTTTQRQKPKRTMNEMKRNNGSSSGTSPGSRGGGISKRTPKKVTKDGQNDDWGDFNNW